MHFPVACWVLAAPCDIAGGVTGDPHWWGIAYLLIGSGLILALPAMIAGGYDFLQLPASAAKTAQRHVMLVGAAWIAYLTTLLFRPSLSDWTTTAPGASALFSEGVGLVLLIIGAWYGGELAYRHRAAIREKNTE